MYAEVLVEYGAKALDRKFTYIIPDKFKDNLQIGMKVIVPFGSTTINGFVVNIMNETENINLKEIVEISKQDFILNDELMKLGKYIKENTLCSLIQAYQCMLPSSMKVKTIKSDYQKYNEYLVLNKKEDALNYIKENKNAKKQIELLNRLFQNHLQTLSLNLLFPESVPCHL